MKVKPNSRAKKLRIVSWNCAMALSRKRSKLLHLKADILIIQECSKFSLEEFTLLPGWSPVWFGKNRHKGLAVFAKSPWIIREAQTLRPRFAARILLDGPFSLELFPVWACRGLNAGEHYVGQVHRLLDIIEKTQISPFAIVAGDFNSNTIWDHEHSTNSHSDAIARFRALGMESAYHSFFKCSHGKERHPTYWHLKNADRAFHLDYAFLSAPLLSKLRRVTVGHHNRWLSLSDHAPLIIDLAP